jgi:hypothetical protein
MTKGPLLALSGHSLSAIRCPLLGVKRTSLRPRGISIYGFRKSFGSLAMLLAIRRALIFAEQRCCRAATRFAFIIGVAQGLTVG